MFINEGTEYLVGRPSPNVTARAQFKASKLFPWLREGEERARELLRSQGVLINTDDDFFKFVVNDELRSWIESRDIVIKRSVDSALRAAQLINLTVGSFEACDVLLDYSYDDGEFELSPVLQLIASRFDDPKTYADHIRREYLRICSDEIQVQRAMFRFRRTLVDSSVISSRLESLERKLAIAMSGVNV